MSNHYDCAVRKLGPDHLLDPGVRLTINATMHVSFTQLRENTEGNLPACGLIKNKQRTFL